MDWIGGIFVPLEVHIELRESLKNRFKVNPSADNRQAKHCQSCPVRRHPASSHVRHGRPASCSARTGQDYDQRKNRGGPTGKIAIIQRLWRAKSSMKNVIPAIAIIFAFNQ